MSEDFDHFYRREHRRLQAAVGAATGRWDVATDAVDLAFEKAFVRWRRVGAMNHPGSWIYRVAVNRVKRDVRRRARGAELLAGMVPDSAVGASDEWIAAVDAVSRLPRRERDVVVLRYVMGYSEIETAQALGLSSGAVGRYLSDGRRALRAALTATDEPPGPSLPSTTERKFA
jgi:RNA polymerase sigma-70 factor (ECF subfamily)